METAEKRNCCVYQFYFDVHENKKLVEHHVFYVGRGNEVRLNDLTRNDEVNQMMERPDSRYKVLYDNLTLLESKLTEARLIKEIGMVCKGTGPLLNRVEGMTDANYNEYISKFEHAKDKETIDAIYELEISNLKGADIPTPEPIMDEWISGIPKTFIEMDGLRVFDPNARFGSITKRVANANVKANLSLFGPHRKISLWMAAGYSINDKGEELNTITTHNENPNVTKTIKRTGKIYNTDFLENFHTNERFDAIFLNPPFEDFGVKFIMKCVEFLKPGGYLCCVMSQYWRSIGTKDKTYKTLLDTGGFIAIHMYSADDTTALFGQSIGNVDTFVWQKGVSNTSTSITNHRGDTFTVDLSKYPQSPPFTNPVEYDKYFDQISGLKYYRYPRNGGGGSKQPMDIAFYDPKSKKTVYCCKGCEERSIGKKKVYIDQSCKKYWVDDTGDQIVNDMPMIYYNTNSERDAIVSALEYIIDNKDLFKNIQNLYIPGIRVK